MSDPSAEAGETSAVRGKRKHELRAGATTMPGAAGRRSTLTPCNTTLPDARAIANKGWDKAAAEDVGLAEGLNVKGGVILHEGMKRFWEGH